MRTLPANVVPYKRTPEFTHATTPAGLLSRHRTKAGVWGRIVVLEGTLTYRILEPEVEETLLGAGACGVIEPEIPHEVAPSEDARFYVEFLRGE